MKKTFLQNCFARCALSAAMVGLVAIWATPTQAQTDTNVFTFDDANSANAWVFNPWGGQGSDSAWDGTQDHTGNGGGSLHIQDDWSLGDQLVNLGWFSGGAWNNSSPIDLTLYTNISFWLKLDPTSTNSDVSLSTFQSTGETTWLWAIGANNTWINFYQFTIPADATNGGWMLINCPVNPTIAGIESSYGLGIKKWTGTGFTGRYAFWVDDFMLYGAGGPPPPPSLGLETPVDGLNLTAVTGPYSRENLRTVAADSWVGHGSTPVSYSFTITQGVDGTGGAEFQNHIFVVPNPGTETAPDWNEPNCLFMDLESTTNGGTSWTFRYKTNEPNGNSMIYNVGDVRSVTVTNGGSGYTDSPTIAFTGGGGTGATATGLVDTVTGTLTNITILTGGTGYATAPTVDISGGGGTGAGATASVFNGLGALGTINDSARTGTWTLTFVNDTNITMTTPSGNSTNITMPYAAAQLIADPAYVYFGCQAGNSAGIGQSSVLSELKITGAANPVDEVFANDSTLDTNIWMVNETDTGGVVLVPTTAAYWVTWTLPDSGFSLAVSTDLSNPNSWADMAGIAPFQKGGKKYALIDDSQLPGPDQGYYRLIKRQYSQLQVLWPGETNAPDTATGKIGTPTPVNVGDIIDVTINAVDSAYHIVNVSGDQIVASSTNDVNVIWAGDGQNNYTTLSGGTAQGIVTISPNPGTYTLTLEDNTNTNIPPATSSSITAN